ncbi:MAG: prepilin-type N-terminal cleavage/methylation domain-containing protein [Opitutaceae bacterium]|nr:prepilin-type N-terminal cleavage/methylation domain-containing protein [Opitutaceae bacterium]
MSWPTTLRAARGFSLLEVLLVVAIVGLIASVLVGGAGTLIGERAVAPNDVFWKAVQEARKTALKSGHEIRLKWDKEKKRFLLLDGTASATLAADGFTREETPLKEFPVPAEGGELAVEFLAPASKGGGGNAILVGGVLLEARTIPHVTFFPDGTCAPFRAQFVRGGGVTVLAIDPWTCAEMLTPPDPYALPAF